MMMEIAFFFTFILACLCFVLYVATRQQLDFERGGGKDTLGVDSGAKINQSELVRLRTEAVMEANALTERVRELENALISARDELGSATSDKASRNKVLGWCNAALEPEDSAFKHSIMQSQLTSRDESRQAKSVAGEGQYTIPDKDFDRVAAEVTAQDDCPNCEQPCICTEKATQATHVKTWACIKPDGDGCDGNHREESSNEGDK